MKTTSYLRRAIVGLGLLLAAAIVWLGIFPLAHSRITTNQIRAAVNMNQLETAQKVYAAKNVSIGYTCDLGELVGVRSGTESEPELIDRLLGTGKRNGYVFSVYDCKSDSAGKVIGYSLSAVPANHDRGKYAFCANERGVVWYSSSGSVAECFESQSPSKLAY